VWAEATEGASSAKVVGTFHDLFVFESTTVSS
jgi:hypothetical protein